MKKSSPATPSDEHEPHLPLRLTPRLERLRSSRC